MGGSSCAISSAHVFPNAHTAHLFADTDHPRAADHGHIPTHADYAIADSTATAQRNIHLHTIASADFH